MSTISKFLALVPNGFSTQIASATVAADALSVNLDATTDLPTEGVGQFFKKDADGEVVAGSVEFVHWTNVSGNTITFSDTDDRGIPGSDSGAQAYVADDYFEVWASSYYTSYGGLVEHLGDGTHDDITATTIKGKTTKFPTVSGEYDNGNSGTAKEINWANGDRQKVTVTGDACAFTFANAVTGQTLTLRVVVDGTGHTAWTWPTLMWPGGSAGTPGITANKINLYIFYYTGSEYLAQLAAEFSTPA
jgi:hypothetical protein